MRKRGNSNTQRRESKLAKHLGSQSWKRNLGRHINIIPDLPLDIILNIISRLPLKLIIGCKSLSQAFNTLLSISNPSFNLPNKSNYIRSIFVHEHEPIDERGLVFTLDLVEFDSDMYLKRTRKLNHTVTNIFNSDILPHPQISSGVCGGFSIWGYCNGLFCLMIIENDLYNLFVINPIFGQEFFQLPDPLPCYENRMLFMSYGLGHCHVTNKFKVLSIVTVWRGGDFFKNTSYIFTIGSDQSWRKVSDVNVQHSIHFGNHNPNPQGCMVAFRSALHWIVQPYPLSQHITIHPSWGGTRFMCAFDMTEEKVTALPLPPDVVTDYLFARISILLDKLCLWQYHPHMELWVMDNYGVQGSWTKKFILKITAVPRDTKPNYLKPLTISPEGVIVMYDCHRLLFFDLKKNKCLKIIHQSVHASYPIPFVPCFISPKSLAQGG